MSLPTFSKVGVTTLTFSKAPIYPAAQPRTLNQFVGVSDDNTVYVSVIGSPLVTIPLQFRQLTRQDAENILAFFEDINYGEDDFTYTDEQGNTYTVRYLEPNFVAPEVHDDDVQFDCTLTRID